MTDVTRIAFDDQSEAEQTAQALFDAVFETALLKERFEGEDDDEEVVHVVATTASEAEARSLIFGEGLVVS